MAALNGKTIAFVEARMSSELAGLIQRHGGVPYSAPVLQEIYLKDSPEVQQLINDVCAGQINVLILLTGVGAQALIETAAAMGRGDEFIRRLDDLVIVARSPKPGRVLRQHKIRLDLMPPEPYTTGDLLNSLAQWDLSGRTVAVQHYGGPNRPLTQYLRERGSQVREAVLYTWGLPQDTAPVKALLDDLTQGNIDALAFTSQPQVGNLLTIAAQTGQEAALRQCLGPSGSTSSVVVASVGPVCSRRLRDAGIAVQVEPEHPHMGSMVLALADYLAAKVDDP